MASLNKILICSRPYVYIERFVSTAALFTFLLIQQHRILPIIFREDSVIMGKDYQKSKYSEDTDIDDVNGINQTCILVAIVFKACLQMSRDRLRHRYLLTTKSMRQMLKALVNN